MSIALYSANRPVELGIVGEIIHTRVNRHAAIDLPGARGEGIELLGSKSTQFTLECALFESTRQLYLNQLNRYRMIGDSLKFINPYMNTVVTFNP